MHYSRYGQKIQGLYKGLSNFHYFVKHFLGCETGKYGDNCTSCEGCKTCDINNGSCGKLKYYLRKSIKHTSSLK